MADQFKSQIEKFREAARELETDDREEVFDAKLKKVAKPKGSSRASRSKKKPTSRLAT